MKTKFKILALASVATAIMPSAMIAASCSCAKDYKAQAETIKEDSIKEFVELSKIYRPTFHTRAICDYLKKRIKELGFDAVEDDQYRAEERQEPGDDSSGNLMFEIPATKGYEDFPKLAVQAHMDMVCKISDDISWYDWKNKGVEVVREDMKDPNDSSKIVNAIHSKDFKTSLGADDGIGLSNILSLVKNRDSYTHGPLQFIITADEEAGPSGAKDVPKKWLENTKYLLNIDGYKINNVIVSCQGASEFQFKKDFNLEQDELSDKNQYKIKISGLKEGHSGLSIGKGHVNAIQSMCGMINFIFKQTYDHITDPDKTVNLVSAICECDYGNIPTGIEFVIATNAKLGTGSETEVGTVLSAVNLFAAYTKLVNPYEDKYTVSCSKVDEADKTKYGLSATDTNLIIQFFTIVPFGPMFFDPDSGSIVTSCNIAGIPHDHYDPEGEESDSAAFTISPGFEDQTKMEVWAGIQGRSSNRDHLGPDPTSIHTEVKGFEDLMENLANFCFGDAGSISSVGWVPPWPIASSKLVDVVMDASREFKQTMYEDNVQGWTETGWFAQNCPHLQMACIGPEAKSISPNADGEHDPGAYLETSSIKQEIEYMLYAFDKIKAKE